jgi:hypothetical protein
MIAKKFIILSLDERIRILDELTDDEKRELYLSSKTPAELGAIEEAIQERKVRRAKSEIRAERQRIIDAGLPPTWKEEDRIIDLPAPVHATSSMSGARERARFSFERAKEAYRRAHAVYVQTRSRKEV